MVTRSMEQSSAVPVQSVRLYQPQSLAALCVGKFEKDMRYTILPQQCALVSSNNCRKVSYFHRALFNQQRKGNEETFRNDESSL